MSPHASPEAPALVVIGFGAMASAIVEGALHAGVLSAARLVAADPAPEARARAATLGCAAFTDPVEALRAAPRDARVLLAVKPQMLADVAAGVADEFSRRAIVSILAGATIGRIHAAFGCERVVRVMPNTPAKIGMGVSAICPGTGASDQDLDFTERLFRAVGQTIPLPEDLMDAFTALAGSGPAYVFYLAEAMNHAGLRMGFDERTTDRVVRAVIEGAAGLLAAEAGRSPAELRAAVTSRGGTTAAATTLLDNRRVGPAIVDAVLAARDRGRELSGPA